MAGSTLSLRQQVRHHGLFLDLLPQLTNDLPAGIVENYSAFECVVARAVLPRVPGLT